MSDIDERVQQKVSQFHIGDLINTLIDDSEIEGRIVSIDGQHAKISTPWGELTAWLAISTLIEEEPFDCPEIDFLDFIDDDDYSDEYPDPWYDRNWDDNDGWWED